MHPDRFIETAQAEQADLVGFSALLSTTVYYQKVTIEEFVKAGHRGKVKILVGGTPTTQEWADECGAEGWGRDAVQLALALVKQPREAWTREQGAGSERRGRRGHGSLENGASLRDAGVPGAIRATCGSMAEMTALQGARRECRNRT